MDLAIVITIVVLAFGVGGWFYRINNQLNKLRQDLTPLIILHKKEFIEYYLEKGITPNPGMTPRKQYLMDALRAGTISLAEYEEFSIMLQREKEEAKRTSNTDALVAVLGLLALIAILTSLSKK